MGSAAAVARLVEGGDNRDERCDAEHRRARRARRRAHHPSRPPALRRARHRPPADGTVALLLSKLLDGLHALEAGLRHRQPRQPLRVVRWVVRKLRRRDAGGQNCAPNCARELRSARLAPRPRNHRILGAVRLGRVGGVHHVTVGDLVDHDRDRAGARRQVRRDDQVLVRRVGRRRAVGAALVAASGHHRDRRGRHSEVLRDDDGDLVRPQVAVWPGRARSVQPRCDVTLRMRATPPKSERAGDVDAGVAPRKVGLGPFEVGVEGRLRSREGGGERGEGEHGGL